MALQICNFSSAALLVPLIPSSPDHYLCRAGWLGWLVAIPFMRIITIIIISVISGHHHIVSINGRLCGAGWWIGYRVALKINTTTTTCRNLDRERDGTGRAGVFAYCIRFAEIITGLESSLTAIAAAPGTYTLPYTETTPITLLFMAFGYMYI